MPWTAERVGMRATRTPSVRACSAAAAAVWRSSASFGSRTTSRAWARRIASTSSPLAGGSPGRASTVVAPASRAQLGQALPGDDGDDGPLHLLAGRTSGAAGVHVAGAEVGDPDPVRPARLDARLHGRARVVDVDMDVPQPVAADDDERVAEPVEPGPQRGDGRVVGLQEVDHLEGRARRPAHASGAVATGRRRRRPPSDRAGSGTRAAPAAPGTPPPAPPP